jgi:hypothetical protein
VRLNEVETEDSRFNPFESEDQYSFLDVVMGPVWIGKKMVNSEMVSYQNGPQKRVEKHLLLGTFYFLSNDRILHQRQVYTILNMLGDFGGLEGLVIGLVVGLCYTMNRSFVLGSFLK